MSYFLKELTFAAEVLQGDVSSRGAAVASANATAVFEHATAPILKAVEAQAHSNLVFLYSLLPITLGAGEHCDPSLFNALIALLVVGSPRIQAFVMRMLRDLLPAVQPNRVNAVVNTEVNKCAHLFKWPGPSGVKGEEEAPLPTTLYDLLLHKVASTLCVTPSGEGACNGSLAQPAGAGAGYAALTVAAEANTLLRALLQGASPVWKAALVDAVVASVVAVAPFVTGPALSGDASRSDACRRAMASAAAAFCVLGADAEVFRSGGRFALANSDQAARAAATAAVAADAGSGVASTGGAGAEAPTASGAAQAIVNKALMSVLQPQGAEGIVLAYTHGSGSASVVFDSEVEGRAVTTSQLLPIDTLVPVCEVPADPAAITLSPDFIRVLLAVCELDVGVAPDALTRGRRNPSTPVAPAEPWSLWRSHLKSRAVQALQVLLQSPANCAAALSADMFPRLLRTALVPVSLPQFVALRWLQYRAHGLRARLLDAASGVIVGQEMAADAGGTRKLSPEEERREGAAGMLVEMGLGAKDLCVMALQLNRDNVEAAAEWLMGPQAQAFVSGRGLEKNVGETNPRWGAARDLGLVVGMHPKLCYHALQLWNDDRNGATTWLMDHGEVYAGSEWILSEDKGAKAAAVTQAKL